MYLEFTLQRDMESLSDWFKANKLSLNLSKTVLIQFWRNKDPLNIEIDGFRIPNVKVTIFLGVFLDDALSWNNQVVHVLSKIQSNKCMLQMARNLLPTYCLWTIYYSHIYSHIHYALSAWGSMISKSQQDEIHTKQKQCIRLVRTEKYNAPTDRLFQEQKIIKFPDMINIELCKFGYKVAHKQVPTWLLQVMGNKGGLQCHRYNTRSKNIPNIHQHTSKIYHRSFMCQSTVAYNKISQQVPKENQWVFMKELKQKYLESY